MAFLDGLVRFRDSSHVNATMQVLVDYVAVPVHAARSPHCERASVNPFAPSFSGSG